MSVAFLFPGQGSQQVNMLHNLPAHPAVQATLEEASAVLGEEVLSLDSETALLSTRAVQVALLTSGVAMARALEAEGARPDFVAGHSVGSFAAAVVSGALQFGDALSLVELRGRLMEKAYPVGYGMGVIIGLGERQVVTLLERSNTVEEPVFIANVNAYDQITIAGKLGGIEKVFAFAHTGGAQRTQLLNVSVPSHCKLLQSVAEKLAVRMANVEIRGAIVPYVGNCRARALWKAEDIREDLVRGVASPVRWNDATMLLFERGTRLFVEVGIGQVLTNMAQKTFVDARTIAMSACGLESAFLLIRREQGV